MSALQNEAWIDHIRLPLLTSVWHLEEFTSLWAQVQQLQIRPEVPGQIVWNLNESGKYSTKSAYAAQFIGAAGTRLDNLIWKVWATSNYKFFEWILYQDRLWTVDSLERREWPKQKKCPLCRHTEESSLHLFAQCQYTRRVWHELGRSLTTYIFSTSACEACDAIPQWWEQSTAETPMKSKASRSLLLLVYWKILKERNARFFQTKVASI